MWLISGMRHWQINDSRNVKITTNIKVIYVNYM